MGSGGGGGRADMGDAGRLGREWIFEFVGLFEKNCCSKAIGKPHGSHSVRKVGCWKVLVLSHWRVRALKSAFSFTGKKDKNVKLCYPK